jgi:4-amino-4-deoxy-L-arabinose transferase-like glycosyltransferase
VIQRLTEKRYALVAVLLPALILRLWGIASRPLWYDEAFAVLFAAKGPAAMIYGTLTSGGGAAADVHPLLYYTLLWLWEQLFGTSPLAARSLSLLFGLIAIVLAMGLARRIFGREASLATGVILATSPFMVHYGQEARMYAMLACLLLGATWLFWEAVHGGLNWAWAGVGLLAAAAMYTHVLAVFFLFVLFASILWLGGRGHWLGVMAAGLLALILYLPWLLQLPMQVAKVAQAYWIPVPGPADAIRTLIGYIAGLPVPEWALGPVLFAALILTIDGGWASARAWRGQSPSASKACWLAALGAIPPILMFAVSQWRSVYLDRAMLPAAAVFLMWIAWSLSEGDLPRLPRLTGWGLLALSFGLGLVGFFSYRGFPYAPFARLDVFLNQNRLPEEVIIHSNKISGLPSVYYDPALPQAYLADPPGSGSDTLAFPTQQVLRFVAAPSVQAVAAGKSGVWFVIFQREIEDYQQQGLADPPALAWLDSHYRLESIRPFGELQLYHFIQPAGEDGP